MFRRAWQQQIAGGRGGLISSRFGARHQAAGGLALAAKQAAADLQER